MSYKSNTTLGCSSILTFFGNNYCIKTDTSQHFEDSDAKFDLSF